ncbi:DUF4097 family beta strand repeat-containing protein [Metabacillus litoralis]|uniref:DUF4097 family beta strand repeat-containing protein n=1 Tax=Metabacillus litoralis TaxID=152268 RepID=UPI001CFCB12F|nr:DUF4097 family beta strand repeat-containing protein [Metabacillus litoralis]
MKKFVLFLFFAGGLLLLIFTNTALGEKDKERAVSDNINTINIDVSGISTTIIPDNRDSIKAELKGKGEMTIRETGNTIKVEYKSKNWFNGLSIFDKSKLTIYIPKNYNQNLLIDSGSGSMTFDGNHMELKELLVNLSSGHIQLSDFKTNLFKIDGSSGNVNIDSLTTNKGEFEINSGNLDVKDYSGEVKVELSSGNMDMEIVKLISTVDIKVNSGFVELDLPSEANFKIDGKIGSGNITSTFNLSNSETTKHKMMGVHGSGEHEVKLDVSSGKIEIK